MKKHLILLFVLFAGVVFAQENTRLLIAGVYDFATNPNESWEILDPAFVQSDQISDSYSFSGGFMIKNFIGNTRYDFICRVNKNGGDFDVILENMNSYACDKSGQIVSAGKIYKTSEKVAAAYADQMKDEIKSRMGKWSDEEYETALNKAVTSPCILNCIASNSSLAFKKFLKDNAVIGRKITMEILVTNIDEAPSYAEGYAYYVGGEVLSGYSVDSLGIKLPKYETVMVYTNNDAVISLTPAKKDFESCLDFQAVFFRILYLKSKPMPQNNPCRFFFTNLNKTT